MRFIPLIRKRKLFGIKGINFNFCLKLKLFKQFYILDSVFFPFYDVYFRRFIVTVYFCVGDSDNKSNYSCQYVADLEPYVLYSHFNVIKFIGFYSSYYVINLSAIS